VEKKYPVKYNYWVPNGRDTDGNTADIFKPKTIILRKIQTYFYSTFVVVSDTLNREFKKTTTATVTKRHQRKGLMSKTMSTHMGYKSLCIAWPSFLPTT